MSKTNHKAVEVRDLEKRFGDFVAVNRISFGVAPGEIFGFLGPNGAGKSTTIKMLCGIFVPSSGSGMVGGFDIVREQKKIKQTTGYMSQRFSLYNDLTVEENIDFYSGIYGVPSRKAKQRKDWVIEMAGLDAFKSQLTRTLPVGWKQRLSLGCALIHEPRILFLDEPTSGVDPIARRNFWNLIKKMASGGVTVFVTTHYMDEAENCDRMALIYKGSIIAIGTSKQLKTEFMTNDILEIVVPGIQDRLEKLTSLDFIKETALFGNTIHAVVTDAQQAKHSIEKFFKDNAVQDYRVTRIEPSLEDVFVSLIEGYDKGQKQ
jgi:ABC-2 type transport system ATP-binding protein